MGIGIAVIKPIKTKEDWIKVIMLWIIAKNYCMKQINYHETAIAVRLEKRVIGQKK